MRSPGDLRGSAKQQTKLIERLTGDENESEESLRVLLRLLIDEIVEDLSRNPWEAGVRKVDALLNRTRFIRLGFRNDRWRSKPFRAARPHARFQFCRDA